MRKFLVCVFMFFWILGFSQEEEFTVENLKINTEYPHFGLMLVNDSKILFTSYLLDIKERLKRFQGNPILTIFEGTVSENGTIQNIKNIEITPDQKINYITGATISSSGKQLFITATIDNSNIQEDNFQIKVGEFKSGVGWTNFKTLPFCNSKYSYHILL